MWRKVAEGIGRFASHLPHEEPPMRLMGLWVEGVWDEVGGGVMMLFVQHTSTAVQPLMCSIRARRYAIEASMMKGTGL